MGNYEYLIACLPVLTADYRYADGASFRSLTDGIRSQLPGRDAAALDLLLEGCSAEGLDADFYARALRHPSRFIREYFRFDLNLRNAKVRYLNHALGRPAGQDIVSGAAPEGVPADPDGNRFTAGEFEEAPRVEEILSEKDLIRREKGLDDLTWAKIDELVVFDYFDLDAVLGFVARLHIVDRWLSLDAETGQALFRRLIEEIRKDGEQIRYDPE